MRTAHGPYPPDSSRCKMKGRKRRFLAYSFSVPLAGPAPSGSAGTSRLCQGRLPPSRVGLPSAPPSRRDGIGDVGLSPPFESIAPHGAPGVLCARSDASRAARSTGRTPRWLQLPGAVADTAVGVVDRGPRRGRDCRDRTGHRLGQPEPDRICQAPGSDSRGTHESRRRHRRGPTPSCRSRYPSTLGT